MSATDQAVKMEAFFAAGAEVWREIAVFQQEMLAQISEMNLGLFAGVWAVPYWRGREVAAREGAVADLWSAAAIQQLDGLAALFEAARGGFGWWAAQKPVEVVAEVVVAAVEPVAAVVEAVEEAGAVGEVVADEAVEKTEEAVKMEEMPVEA